MWSPHLNITNDERSFRKIVQNYTPLLFSLISKKINEREDVKDVLQNVYIHLWTYRNMINSDNLEGVVVNTCNQKIAEFYRTNVKLNFFGKAIDENINVSEDETDIVELQEAHFVQIENAIHNLIPPIRQKIFKMNKLEGVTQEKIAEQLNLSKRNVKFHIEQSLIFVKEYVRIRNNR